MHSVVCAVVRAVSARLSVRLSVTRVYFLYCVETTKLIIKQLVRTGL